MTGAAGWVSGYALCPAGHPAQKPRSSKATGRPSASADSSASAAVESPPRQGIRSAPLGESAAGTRQQSIAIIPLVVGVISNPGTDRASVGQATAQRPQSTQPEANSGPSDVATSAPVGQASMQRRQDSSGNRAGMQASA